MKTSLKVALALASMALIPAMVRADTVNIYLTAQSLYSRPGVLLPTGSTVEVLVDKNGNNDFGAITGGTWLPDPGDAILAQFPSLGGGMADTHLNFDIAATNSSTVIGPGDKILLVWFETPFATNNPTLTNGPGGGVFYGSYRSDDVIDGDFNFTIPAGGATGAMLAIDTQNGGSVPLSGQGSLVANLGQTAAVPEPASLAVLALGGCLLALRRRRA